MQNSKLETEMVSDNALVSLEDQELERLLQNYLTLCMQGKKVEKWLVKRILSLCHDSVTYCDISIAQLLGELMQAVSFAPTRRPDEFDLAIEAVKSRGWTALAFLIEAAAEGRLSPLPNDAFLRLL